VPPPTVVPPLIPTPAPPTLAPPPSAAARTPPVAGLERLSLVDWPGHLAAVVFTQGCAWACPYCHNPHLIPRTGLGSLDWSGIVGWLRRRAGLLDGVVFSGGEPTLHAGLAPAIDEVRALGFATALHTGGPSPQRLAGLLTRLDWVGLDIKAPFSGYAAITGRDDGARARESLRLLVASGLPFEARTTWHPSLLDDDALETMAYELRAEGCARWVIQRFRLDGCRDPRLPPVPTAPLSVARLEKSGITVVLR